jgi:hypothetical protein
MPDHEDLNTIVVTGHPSKPPVFDSDQWSYLELAVRNGGAVCYIVLHVPDRLRRVLYDVGPEDTLLARGELAYCRRASGVGGSHVIKCRSVEKVTGGWLFEPEASAPSGRVAPVPVVEPVTAQGSRQKRHRKRRSRPEGRR